MSQPSTFRTSPLESIASEAATPSRIIPVDATGRRLRLTEPPGAARVAPMDHIDLNADSAGAAAHNRGELASAHARTIVAIAHPEIPRWACLRDEVDEAYL